MLKDIVVQALKEVQKDCLSLSKQHYPTVHNRGMSNNHLTTMVERRLRCVAQGYDSLLVSEPLVINNTSTENTTHYRRLTTQFGTVWLFSDSIKTANKVYKQQLVDRLSLWRDEYGFAIHPYDCLVLVSDHWFSRVTTSQQVLDWWLHQLPEHTDDYAQQGVYLTRSEQPKLDELMSTLKLSACYKAHTHPLKREMDESPIRRYVHLYAIFECQ